MKIRIIRSIAYMFLLCPLFLKAQDGKGIHFEQSLNWQQIKAKARADNKYIFVDCYATWCVPCKEMDKSIYPLEKVGNYFNEHFISAKAQMDSTGQDDQQTRNWYPSVRQLVQEGHITAYPTFLFFSPDGVLVHKAVGYQEAQAFIDLAKAATDPSKQYYTVLNNYQQGKKDYKGMAELANMARRLGDEQIAEDVATDYIDNYFLKLPEKDLYTKDNLYFMANFTSSSKDKGFGIFYHHAQKSDSALNDSNRLARRVVDFIISKEDIYPHLWKDGNWQEQALTQKPVWGQMQQAIQKKYGKSYAERTIMDAKIGWAEYRKDTAALIRYNMEKLDKFGLDMLSLKKGGVPGGMARNNVNNMLWELCFEHSKDRETLSKAAHWQKIIVDIDSSNAANTDTYANLVYKLGRKEEAIRYEQKAVQLASQSAIKDPVFKDVYTGLVSSYKVNIAKMQQGKPTWDN